MKTETKTYAEYKAPKCKVVALTLSASCLQVASPNGIDNAEETDYGVY